MFIPLKSQRILNILILSVVLAFPGLTHAKVTLEAVYSESANTFDLMDGVSNWWPDFVEPEYQADWAARFGLNDGDKAQFKIYQALREKHYNDPDQGQPDPHKNRNGLFSMEGSRDADPVADAFYSSQTLEESYAKLSKSLRSEEIDVLKKFYAHFESKYALLLAESKKFQALAKKMNAAISAPKQAAYIQKILKFYGVTEDLRYRALFTWWPIKGRSQATPVGDTLIFRYDPKAVDRSIDTDVFFHEVVHTVSSRLPLEKKKKLTEQFLSECDPSAHLKKLWIFEEPMAVALGQILYRQRLEPKRFRYGAEEYRNQWINVFGKLLAPAVQASFDRGETIQDGIVPVAAKLCKQLVGAADLLK